MAGSFFDKRQASIDPWGRGNNQDERLDPWMGPEDRGRPMRRDLSQLDIERSQGPMGMRRDEMNNQRQQDWYDDEDFPEDRFRNERASTNFPGQEQRNVQRGLKRQKPQQRYQEIADSVFQSEAMQNRAREKELSHDEIGGPYTNSVWDRQNPTRDDYYHKSSMGVADSGRDRNAMRYEDGPPSRQSNNYNFDFTDKGGNNTSAAPGPAVWNKPGVENASLQLSRKQQQQQQQKNPNWNAESRMAPSDSESLYTRRPRQPEDQLRNEDDLRTIWDEGDRAISNMDVYRVRMATQAKQQKCREDDTPGSRFREKQERSGDVAGARSTGSVDSDEFLYQEKPAAKHAAAEERKDPFWENLNKRSDKPITREKADAQKPAASIGDVLVETLLKHITQTVDSSKQSVSGLQKEGVKPADLAQQLISILSSSATESRPEETKEVRKADRAVFENRPIQVIRQDDSGMVPAKAAPLPKPVAPVSSAASFGGASNYHPRPAYPPPPTSQYPYVQQPMPAPLLPVSQPDYQYGRAPAAPQMQSAYISHPTQPPMMAPPAMVPQMMPQPLHPPGMGPFPPRPLIPPLFPNFTPVSAIPSPYMAGVAARLGIKSTTDAQQNIWRSQQLQNNAKRCSILTPVPQSVEKRSDKGTAASSSAKAAKEQSGSSAATKSFAVSSYKAPYKVPHGFDKSRSSSSTKTSSSFSKPAVTASKPASRSSSSSSKTASSTSRDAAASKRSSSLSKAPASTRTGSSASREGKSTKDDSATSRSTPPTKADCPVPKTVEERKKLTEQEVQLKKKVELLHVELNRLKNKCAHRMEILRDDERSTDPKLAEGRKLQDEIKAHVESAKDELQAVRNSLKASVHLEASAPRESASAAPARARKAPAESKTREKSKAIVLNLKSSSRAPAAAEELKALDVSGPASTPGKHYRFTDNGDHWCKHCDIVMPVADSLLKHLQRKHYDVMQRIPAAERPWAEKPPESKLGPGDKYTYLPFRGAEFMIPCDSFYCNLCKELFGDLGAARGHLESLKHNANYSKFCKSNPSYAKQILSVLNAQKKQEKKLKDLPVEKTQHEDVDVLPTVTDKKEPEIIDIDDDDTSVSTDKQSSKTKLEDAKEEKPVSDSKKPSEATSSGSSRADVKKGGVKSLKKSPDACKDSAKKTAEEDVFEKVSDDELVEDSPQESGVAQKSHIESAVASQNENVFDKISDDEMEDFAMIDGQASDENVADKKNAPAVEQPAEDAITKDENGEDLDENYFENADIRIVDDADVDNDNNESAEIVIEEDADEDNDGDGNAIEEDDFLMVPGDEDDVLGDADLEESTDILDDSTEAAAKENEVMDVVKEGVENVVDEVIDDADDENMDQDVAVAEGEVVNDAGEEEEVVDEIVEDPRGEDEVVDDAGGEDEAVDDAGGKDVVGDVAEEEVASAMAATEEEEMEEGVTAVVDEDAAAEGEEEEVVAVVEEEAAEDVAVVEEEAAEDVAVVEEEAAEDVEEEAAENVAAEMEEGAHVVDEVEEGADIAAEEHKLEDAAQSVQDKASNDQINMDASATIHDEDADNVPENTGTETVAEGDHDEGHGELFADKVDKDDAVGGDANTAALENIDEDAAKEDVAVIVSTEVAHDETLDEEFLSNVDALLENTAMPAAEILGDDVATVDPPLEISGLVSLADEASATNLQEAGMTDKDNEPSTAADLVENQSKGVDTETSEATGHSQTTATVEGNASSKLSEVDIKSLDDPPLDSTSETSSFVVKVETISENQAPPAKRRQMAICSRGRGRGVGRGRVFSPQVLQSKGEGEEVTQEPAKKITPSRYTRGAKSETTPPTRVGTRSSRQATVEVVKLPEAELPSRPRRQPPRATASAAGVKRDQGGRPVRGKTVLEDDVIDLASPEPSDLKKLDLPDVNAGEAKPSVLAARRRRQKTTPRRAALEAATKTMQGQDQAAKENAEVEAKELWQITEVVTLVDEEVNKCNLDTATSLVAEAENQGSEEPEEMETSVSLEGGEGINLVELSADEDDAKLEKMEAMLLGDPFPNLADVDEADDACLESDLEIVDEAEDTD